jgi:threonine/homoserine/homoserine lactone efflux protein
VAGDPLISMAIILLFAVMSPGPDFLVVSTTALIRGRTAGIFVAAGIGTGSLSYAALCAAGLSTIFVRAPLMAVLMKTLGGLYLIGLALHIWLRARHQK